MSNTKIGRRTTLRAGFVALAFAPVVASAALVVTPTNDITTLSDALVTSGTGLTILSSELTIGGATQQGTYSNFNLAPSSGTSPTLTMADGVVLTTGGNAVVPLENTVNNYSTPVNGPGFAPLTTLSGSTTFDANVLTFTFSLAEGLNSVRMEFVFATDEFPTQTVTDIFGVFVDGVNYARFPNGNLIQNTPGNPTNFISNPVGGGLYDIEWNGLTQVFTLSGLVNPDLAVHTLEIAIADTSDRIFDSAVYISGLRGAATTGGGGIGDEPTAVPLPGTLALLGLGMFGLAVVRRRTEHQQ